jgi:uncharacterized protein YrrD
MNFRNTQLFMKYGILAQDGEVGKVKDFLFDDVSWTLRYIVVDTGTWLPGRKVLLSPESVQESKWDTEQFVVNLTTTQIEDSPSINEEQPVSLQHQIELHDYYTWPYYWAGGLTPVYPAVIPTVGAPQPANQRPKEEHRDPHLRSTREVIGYHIQATDGEIGHVDDFLIDDAEWRIHYLVVDTRNWLPGRKVLISPTWMTDVDWAARKVTVFLTRESVKNSPEYAPSEPVSADYEDDLYEHYGLKDFRSAFFAAQHVSQPK